MRSEVGTDEDTQSPALASTWAHTGVRAHMGVPDIPHRHAEKERVQSGGLWRPPGPGEDAMTC